MPRLLDIETRPYYAQVAIFDPTVAGSYPDWGAGEAEAVASDSGIAVESRPDDLGLVRVEVWAGATQDRESLREVLDATIAVFGGEGVLVGSVTGNDLHRVSLPSGRYRVKVLVRGSRGGVERIVFEFPGMGATAT